MESPSLNKSHWRKSGQWFALQRRHAELVVADTEVAEAFKQCVSTALNSSSYLSHIVHGVENLLPQPTCFEC